MATVSIPLSAPVDLETKSIIQGDFSYSRKNSIVHQGLLSNLTNKKGTGLLSTTGKELYSLRGVVGKQTISGEAVKTLNIEETEGIVKSSISKIVNGSIYTATIVSVGDVDFIVRQYKDGELLYSHNVHTATQSATYITNSFDMTVLEDKYFAVINVHTDKEGNTYEWRGVYQFETETPISSSNGVQALRIKLGGEIQIAYDGSIWVGFEDVDLRKRCSYCYTDKNQFVTGAGKEDNMTYCSARIPGFGTLSKTICGIDHFHNVVITGEPIFALTRNFQYYNTKFYASTNAIWQDSAVYDTSAERNKYDPMNFGTYKNYGSIGVTVLDNGVLQVDPFYPKGDVPNTIEYYNWTDSDTRVYGTTTKTYMELLQGLKQNPDSVDGTQTGVSDFPPCAFYDYQVDFTEDNDFQSNFLCFYAFISNKQGSFYSKSFDATTRAYLPNAFTSKDNPTTRFAGAKTGTAISFLDYNNPIGLLGTAIADVNDPYLGQQLFPHARWFVNDTTKKGELWDYGRGWTTFIKDTIEVYKMGNTFRVFERPLELWRFTIEEAYNLDYNQGRYTALSTGPKISYLDIVSQQHTTTTMSTWQSDTPPISGVSSFNRWGVDNIGNDKNEVIKETEFQLFSYPTSSTRQDLIMNFGFAPYYELFMSDPKNIRIRIDDSGGLQNYSTWTGNNFGSSGESKDYLLLLNQYYATKARLLRYHPIVEAQLASTSWKYSHHLGGEGVQSPLSAIPWSFGIWPSYVQVRYYDTSSPRMQIYNGEVVSVSVNDVLMTTPHDLKDLYNFVDAPSESGRYTGFTMWDENAVYICYHDYDYRYDTPTTGFTKLTDYVFKAPFISKYPNVLSEKRSGLFTTAKAFIPYIMDSIIDTENKGFAPKLPQDSDSMVSNDTYMYGFGYNTQVTDENAVSSSFLLPAVVIPSYCDADDLYKFNSIILNGRKGLFRADVRNYFAPGYPIDEYWTHSQASTDITYKNSREYIDYFDTKDEYREELANTSWWLTADTVLYPVGYLSKTYGENYITATVDVGDNYVSRFYRNNNKTLLNFNMKDTVYYGSEIFTIQSGNYYFDGQGIYYLGSQSDYSQNIFTAYAIGMKFLANSSSEAYFYSEWDKCLYLYTASNTLQKAQSLADMGKVIDSLYGSAEQALYILFEGGKLFVKTQSDSCIIENVEGNLLQSTNVGVEVLSSNTYEIHNPHLWEDIDELHIETEWLGNPDAVSKYQYVDIVLYSDVPVEKTFNVTVQALNGGIVQESTQKVKTNIPDWKNKLCRIRVVPKEIVGNAVKVIIDSTDAISIFNLSIAAEQTSTIPSAARNKRY